MSYLSWVQSYSGVADIVTVETKRSINVLFKIRIIPDAHVIDTEMRKYNCVSINFRKR